MLAADKDAMLRELKLHMMEIQWKELDYLHKNFINLVTTTSVLVGFGVTSFQITNTYNPQTDTPNNSIWELGCAHWCSWYFQTQLIADAFFYATASIGLAWNVLALFISGLSIMCGPGLALRGPEGSVPVSVRHLESMLKRALRFFGRGVIAFTLSLVTIGLRQMHTIGFLGGGFSVLIGIAVLRLLWTYGSDMAEKFYVSPDRAVRGTFIHGPGGIPEWRNTTAEISDVQVSSGWWICGFEIGRRTKRWRPEGHSSTTPLWRADKLITFPYHDEEKMQRKILTHSQRLKEQSVDAGAEREREQVQHLVRNAQKTPAGYKDTKPEHAEHTPMSFEVLNPMQMFGLVGQALTGGADSSYANHYTGPQAAQQQQGQQQQRGARTAQQPQRGWQAGQPPPPKRKERGEPRRTGS